VVANHGISFWLARQKSMPIDEYEDLCMGGFVSAEEIGGKEASGF
jgi:hypothetical protein